MNIIYNYSIYNGNIIEIILKKYIKNKNYNENITLLELYNITQKSLNIVVANITTLEEELINYKTKPNLEVYKAIEMGLTIPFYIKPFRYNNHVYISGIFMNNFPICYCDMNETIGLITTNISNKCDNLIEFIMLIIYTIIRTDYKKHNNILEFENINDLNFNINNEEIMDSYNYGKLKMNTFINNRKWFKIYIKYKNIIK